MTNTIVHITKRSVAVFFVTAAMFAMFFAPMAASAQTGVTATGTADFGLGANDAASNLGLGNTRLDNAVVDLINVLLGFLGLIAVVIILIGGFRWMTAGGNEDKVAEARKTIFAGIIGLAIILFAWGITTFVVQELGKASGAAGLGGSL